MEISQGLTGPNRKKFQLLVLLSALPEGISLQVLKRQEAEVNISGTATFSIKCFFGFGYYDEF